MTTKKTEPQTLASAFAAAQGEMGNAQKNLTNSHFNSGYADLATLRDVVMPVLSSHGIALIQMVNGDGSYVSVTTRIMGHGEQMDCGSLTIPITGARNVSHAIGSAITYARRFQLGAVAGISATDDDDGNALKGVQPQKSNPVRSTPAQEVRIILKHKVGADSREAADQVIRLVSEGSMGVGDIDAQPEVIHGLLHRAWESQGCDWSELLTLAREG